MPRLLVDISGHGLGHLAQTAPVLDALAARRPDVRLLVRSALARERLARRIAAPFEHVAAAADFGFEMRNALDIDLPATAARYRDFHAGWAQRVAREAAWQRAQGVDLVLANVAYLPLAGAAAAGIPSVALCSLNWADLFDHYFGREAWAPAIQVQMRAAYRAARVFLRPQPSMPMAALANARAVGPIAPRGTERRAELAARLGIGAGRRCVLVALGGIELRLPVESWPEAADIAWLVPSAWGVRRPGFHAFEDAGLGFTDLLASVDAVLTKPGYGTFAEAAVHGTPVLHVERGDWPEAPPLIAWLEAHGRARRVTRTDCERGALRAALDALWARPAPARPEPTGAGEAAEILAGMVP